MKILNYFKGSNIFLVVLCFSFLFLFFSVDVNAYSTYLTYGDNFTNYSLNYRHSGSGLINYTPLSPYYQDNFRIGLWGNTNPNFTISSFNVSINQSLNMRLPATSSGLGRITFYMPECNYRNCFLNPDTRIAFNTIYTNIAASFANYNSYFALVYLNSPTSTIINGTPAFKLLYRDDEDGHAGGFCDLPTNPSISMRDFNYNISYLRSLNHTDYYGYITQCSNSIFYDKPFNAFIITGDNSVWSGGYYNYNLSIDNLVISGINNYTEIPSNNTLPYLNNIISDYTKVDKCINTSQSNPVVYLNLDVNATDDEEDGIYYSIKTQNKKDVFKDVRYNSRNCFLLFCSNSPLWNFYTSVVYRNGDCYYNKSTNIGNGDYINLVYYWFADKYLTRISDSCNGNSAYNYFIEYPLDNVYYSTDVYDFNNGDSFNLTLYTNGFQNVTTKLRFVNNNGNLTIYSHNGTLLINQEHLGDLGLPFTNAPLDFTIYEYPTYNQLSINNNIYNVDSINIIYPNTLVVDELRNNKTYNKVSNLSTQIFSIEVNSGTIFLDTFWYGGTEVKPVYQTSSLFQLKYNTKGNKCEKLYLTDGFEINKSFNSYDFCNEIFNCNEVYYYPEQDTENMLSGFNEGGLTGLPLLVAQLIFLIQFPSRFIITLGLGGLMVSVTFVCLIVFFVWHFYQTHDFKSTAYITFFNACILALMGFLYVDVFVLFALLFSVFFASEFGESYFSETSYTKFFIRAYAMFVGIMLIAQISVGTNIGFVDIVFPSSWGINELLEFAVTTIGFVLSLLFFTYIPSTETYITFFIVILINVILWVSRLIVLIENFKYVKELIPFIN